MEQEKQKIKKLVVLSPEFYKKLLNEKHNTLENLLEPEEAFMKIFNNKSLSKLHKLALYNNIFKMFTLHGKNNSENLVNSVETQTDNVMDPEIKVQSSSSSPFSNDFNRYSRSFTRQSTPIKSSSKDESSFKRNSFPLNEESIYENSFPVSKKFESESDSEYFDMSKEKKSFVERIKEQTGEKNVSFTPYLVNKKFEDPNLSYFDLINKNTDDIHTVHKPKSLVKRQMAELKDSERAKRNKSVDSDDQIYKDPQTSRSFLPGYRPLNLVWRTHESKIIRSSLVDSPKTPKTSKIPKSSKTPKTDSPKTSRKKK